MKICTSCKVKKTKSDFSKHRGGLHPQCRECRNVAGKLYRLNNKEKVAKSKKNM